MAQQAPLSSTSLQVFHQAGIFQLLLLQVAFATTAVAQAPQQQYVFGSVPLTTTTSQMAAYIKDGATGPPSAVPGPAFPGRPPGGGNALDRVGPFPFCAKSNPQKLFMFQI